MSLLIYVVLMAGLLVGAWYTCDGREKTNPKVVMNRKIAS